MAGKQDRMQHTQTLFFGFLDILLLNYPVLPTNFLKHFYLTWWLMADGRGQYYYILSTGLLGYKNSISILNPAICFFSLIIFSTQWQKIMQHYSRLLLNFFWWNYYYILLPSLCYSIFLFICFLVWKIAIRGHKINCKVVNK